MNTYIALFRGINVGGNNILPMKDLVKIIEDLGCKKITTYLQSGNVVFQTEKEDANKISREISSRILERHKFELKVLLLELSELKDAVDNNPFTTKDGKALHFFFLDSYPSNPDLAKLNKVKAESEEFKLHKKVFYLFAPDGFGRSKLAAKVEQSLGVPVTARNWNTLSKLVAIAKQ